MATQTQQNDELEERLVDIMGNTVEGLPARYDNIDERGGVLYLDEERLRRKERPGKALFTNHKNGLGIKNFLVTHLSARDWNWKLVLVLFRKLVAWSAFMKQPETRKSKLYKKAMYFDPEETTYSTGTIYNLAVDADEPVPGTAAYLEQVRARKAATADAEGAADAGGEAEPATGAGTTGADAAGARTGAEAATGKAPAAAHDHAEREAFACKAHREAAGANGTTIELNRTLSVDAERDFRSVVVPMDLVHKAIDEALYIGGMKECLCRAGNDCQAYPHDLGCLFLNMGGKVVVDHGMAVEFTKEQAHERVNKAAELGLVCESLWVEVEQLIWGFRNDQMDAFLEICFCCPCCCVAFNLSKNATRDVKRRFSPSGWTAVVDHELCVGCRKCLDDYCPQDAVHFRASDGKMVVDQENCVGCGFCRSRCPQGAIKLKQTMPMRASVHEYKLLEGRLNIVPGMDVEAGTPIDGALERATMAAGDVAAQAVAGVGAKAAEVARERSEKLQAKADQMEAAARLAEGVRSDIERKESEHDG